MENLLLRGNNFFGVFGTPLDIILQFPEFYKSEQFQTQFLYKVKMNKNELLLSQF